MTKFHIKKRETRNLLLARGIEVIILIALVIVVILLSTRVEKERRIFLENERRAEQEPEQQLQAITLQKAFRNRLDQVEQLEQLVVTEDTIGNFINWIEHSARQSNVVVQISEVTEEKVLDADGNLVPPAGTFRAVRLKIQAIGEPLDLLRWLFSVEYAPFLNSAVNWSLQTENSIAVAPGFANQAPVFNREEPVTLSGRLNVDIILTVRHEDF